MAPAWSPSEIRLQPFSMNVDAPMWSAWTAGREPVNSGAAASAVEAASCLYRSTRARICSFRSDSSAIAASTCLK